MGKEVTIAVYKPDTQSTEEYMVVVDPTEYKKYKDGDTSVALSLIVDSFTVFHSSTGHTGQWGKASKQQLKNTFDTEDEDIAAKKIVDQGQVKSGTSFASNIGIPNLSRGGKDARVTR